MILRPLASKTATFFQVRSKWSLVDAMSLSAADFITFSSCTT